MALSTFAELKTSIADFLNRDDLTSIIPTFITLAEADISRTLRHYKMEARATGQQSSGDQFMQVPSDWLENVRMTVTGSGTSVVRPASRDEIADRRQKNENVSTQSPYLYAMVDGQFELYPTPVEDTDVELVYYQKVPALSDSNTTNWLLSDAPDVYLYGALVHSAPYLQEDARTAVWAQLYSASMLKLQEASDKARYSGSGLKMRVRGLG